LTPAYKMNWSVLR